jgi:hypothetical protein
MKVFYLEIAWMDDMFTTPIGVYSTLEKAKEAASIRLTNLAETYDMDSETERRSETITGWIPSPANFTWTSETDSLLDCYFEIFELEMDATW